MGKFFKQLKTKLQRYDSMEEPIIDDSDLNSDSDLEYDFDFIDKVNKYTFFKYFFFVSRILIKTIKMDYPWNKNNLSPILFRKWVK